MGMVYHLVDICTAIIFITINKAICDNFYTINFSRRRFQKRREKEKHHANYARPTNNSTSKYVINRQVTIVNYPYQNQNMQNNDENNQNNIIAHQTYTHGQNQQN